jgi:cysteine-rich repeat protein
MMIKKIQHYLALVFMIGLLSVQSLVWVATRASEEPEYLLQAHFVQPTIGEVVPPDTQFDIQAMLSADTDSDFSVVYFNLSNPAQDIDLNYETFLADNSFWQSINYVDTSQLPGGVYNLSAIAHVYVNDILIDSWQSEPQSLDIAGGTEMAAEDDPMQEIIINISSPVDNEIVTGDSIDMLADINIVMPAMDFVLLDGNGTSIKRESGTLVPGSVYNWQGSFVIDDLDNGNYIVTADLEPSYPDNNLIIDEVPIVIERGVPLDDPLEGTIISPTTEQVSGMVDIIVEFSEPLNSQQLPEAYIMRGGDVATILPMMAMEERATAYWDTTLLNNDVYNIVIFLDNEDIVSKEVVVDNIINPVISLMTPANNSVVTESNFQVEFETNFLASVFSFELFNTADPSISTGQTTINTTDGQHWSSTVNLTEVFIDGGYTLSAMASGGEIPSDLPAEFHLTVDLVEDDPSEPAITMIQPDAGTTISSDSFQAEFSTNFYADDFTVEFLNMNDASITTGLLSIDRTDGYSWSTTINLNGTFIDGTYSLLTGALSEDLPNGSMATAFSYLPLDREDDDPPPEVPEDIILELHNPGSNLSDTVTLQAEANYNNLELDFVISNSTDQEEIMRLPATFYEDIYIANLDTILLDNNNYYLLVSTVFEEIEINSDSILVTIYNTPEGDGEYCGDGEINGENEECDDGNNEDGDGCSEICTVETEEPYCGDGNIDENEECDDGNNEDGDGCSEICVLEIDDPGDEGNDGNENTNQNENNNTNDNNQPGDDGVVIYDLDTSCLEAGILDEATCAHFLSLLNDSIDPICLEQSIYDAAACEDYLNIIYVDPECQEADIIDREQCKDYLLEKYVSRVDCRLDDQSLCSSILRDEYLNRLVVEINQQQIVAGVLEPLLGQHVNIQDLDSQLDNEGVEDILPLDTTDDIQVLLTNSQEEIVLENQDILTVLNGAVLIVDTDGDGLPDDLEDYYGTDINNPDTDGDGYDDGTEIKNNYNPAGDGQLEVERTVFDEIILSNTSLKQPKLSPINVDNGLVVDDIVNVDDNIKLNGQADPDTWINIYLYSDLPLVMTTKTDANGNWSYTIQKSLQDDHHRVYVTVNSMTGKVVKQSAPTSFLVKSARAVTADDYFDTATATDTTSNMILYYIVAAGLLVLLGLGAIVLLHRRKSGNLEV